ncbi:MAG: twin-arginine translocase TatA/TatE family subunit [Microbacteriaceae bacterium]|jgi:sec-independent protein translocase protein TatA
MIRGIEAPELLIVAALVLVLFGGAKLPEIARSLGRSIRIFTTESRSAGKPAHTDEQSASDPRAGTDL